MEEKLFITPVYGVRFKSDSLKKLKVGLVTFTTYKNLRQTRKSYKINYTIGEFFKGFSLRSVAESILTSSDTIAVVQFNKLKRADWAEKELANKEEKSTFRTYDQSDGRCGLCGRSSCSGGCFK